MYFIKQNYLTIVGVVIGAIAGFLYWQQVGCASGTCAITSKPLNSTLYGALMGGLLFNLFKTKNNMFNFLKKALGINTTDNNYHQLVNAGAIILDVRSAGEFASGHINGAINISVDTLKNNLSKLKNKNQTIITCCASGMRSNVAKSILQASGYTQVYNGGSWSNLNSKINQN
jgi:rhodanese-related sulfurtransferase